MASYKAGTVSLQNDDVQSLIMNVRNINRKEGMGPPRYVCWIHAATLQYILDWANLTVADREAFSEYLEAEKACFQITANGDLDEQALGAPDAFIPEHNDPVFRAAKHIKSPAHLKMFYERIAVRSVQNAVLRATADPRFLLPGVSARSRKYARRRMRVVQRSE